MLQETSGYWIHFLGPYTPANSKYSYINLYWATTFRHFFIHFLLFHLSKFTKHCIALETLFVAKLYPILQPQKKPKIQLFILKWNIFVYPTSCYVYKDVIIYDFANQGGLVTYCMYLCARGFLRYSLCLKINRTSCLGGFADNSLAEGVLRNL